MLAKVSRRHCLLLVVLVGIGLLVVLQSPRSSAAEGNGGTDFWLGFPAAASNSPQLVLGFTAIAATSGTVSVPGSQFTQSFTVTPGAETDVLVPLSAEDSANDTVTTGHGIHVVASGDVSVDAVYEDSGLSDGYLGLSTPLLGTNYIVGAVPGNSTCGSPEFEIVATQDSTTVSITPTVTIGTHAAGTTYTEQLAAGSTYLGQGSNSGDVSGTQITSNNPVALIAGNSCGQVPAGTGYANALMEDEPPVSEWGTQFFTLPFASRTSGDQYVVVTSEPNTTIMRNGALLATLNADSVYRPAPFTDASHITASEPILLEHLAVGGSTDNAGDPTMIDVPPEAHYTRIQTVAIPALTAIDSNSAANNYLNVSIATSDIATLTLDGQSVPASDFSLVGDSSSESGAQIPVSPGEHTLEAAGPFGVEAYGFDPAGADAFGFPGGFGDPTRAAAPGISISVPMNGASYADGQAISAAYACSAAVGTEITSCAGSAANGAPVDTTTAGQHTFSVTADDGYGGQSTQTVTYTVVAPPASTPATPSSTSASTTPQTATTVGAPPNRFGIAHPIVNRATGAETVTVDVPGPGRVSGVESTTVTARTALAEDHLKRTAALVIARTALSVKNARKVTLTFIPGAKGKRLLRLHHTLAVTLSITYTPKHGTPRTATLHDRI